MKKIYSICLAIALGSLVLASCSNNDYTEKTSSVQIIEAETNIPVAGGSKQFLVVEGKVEDVSAVKNIYDYKGVQSDEAAAAKILTASAADEWLSVSTEGNIITVTAGANDGMQTRHTLVTITGASGDKAIVNVCQAGLVIVNEADNIYLFEANDIDGAEFMDMSNIDYDVTLSDDWIHLAKSENGYTISVDKNTGVYRKGTINLKYRDKIDKTINIGQWGEALPSFVGQHTAVYQDENGETYTKQVEIVENGTDAYLIKNLVDEGDIAFKLNPNTSGTSSEWYIAAGYLIGTRTEGTMTLRLRCILSAYTAATGNRYYPTANTTMATNNYRIALGWYVDDEANLVFGTKRNTTLPASYLTDGFLVCGYNHASSLAATMRKTTDYQFLNLVFQ